MERKKEKLQKKVKRENMKIKGKKKGNQVKNFEGKRKRVVNKKEKREL